MEGDLRRSGIKASFLYQEHETLKSALLRGHKVVQSEFHELVAYWVAF